ncbi:MAG: MerR family transcriptional regulator, partial [Bdellovibrionales bacterium]|nr:MerR family transcriptional regulator [Bdellovibrionales bacterium]
MTDTTYTIQMASKISGVGVHTIRAWEKRYKALVPERDASGHRTYTKSDVEKLMLLSELCLLGYTISKVAALSTPELKDQLKNLGKSDESLENQDFNLIHDTKATIDPNQSLPILVFALRSYNLDVINVELTKLKSMLSSHDYALKVLIPLIEILSDLYKSGTYQTHQEQAVRSLLRFHTGFSLYHPADKKEKGSVNAIVTGVLGDINDLLLGVSGLLCGHYGFHYTFLGPNLSSESVLDIVKSFEANLLIVGPVSLQISSRELQ